MTEIEVNIFAVGLIILRIIAILLVSTVVVRQAKIWHEVSKSGVKEKAGIFRVLLFALAVTMLIKNIVPFIVDIIAATQLGGEILEFSTLSDAIILQYFTSNAILDLVCSTIIWLLYREAKRYS